MSTPPTSCQAFEADLSALLDAELGSERAAEVRDHAAACEHCGPRLAALERVDARLAEVDLRPLPAGLAESLRARVEAEGAVRPAPDPARRAPSRVRRPGRGAVAAAVAAAALALYLALGDAPEPLPGSAPELPIARSEGSAPEAAQDLLDEFSDDELAVALELDIVSDLEVIANLELLEALLSLEEGTG